MSERQVILETLYKIRRRIMVNRHVGNLTLGISIALVQLIVFEVWDLFLLIPQSTLRSILGLWLLAVVGYVVWELLHKGTLGEAASGVDSRALLHDEMKTAYWFMKQRVHSPWVDFQIRHASETARRLNIQRYFPLVVPRNSYVAGGLLIVVLVLNLVAVPPSWLHSEPTSSVSLSEEEREILRDVQDILQQEDTSEELKLASRLQQLSRRLQKGEILSADALLQFEDIRNLLEEGNLDIANITEGLQEMAGHLRKSEMIKKAATFLVNRDLRAAAREFQQQAEELSSSAQTREELRELQQALEHGSRDAREGLERLVSTMKQTSRSLKRNDELEARKGLQNMTVELEDLARKIERQILKNDAGRQLQALKQALERKSGQKRAPSGKKATGNGRERGTTLSSATKLSRAQGRPNNTSPEAKGQYPSGNRISGSKLPGRSTSLAVQLEKERLQTQIGEGQPGREEVVEEASTAQRSNLPYQNLRSKPIVSEQDLLHQSRIPLQYRQLIKKYFSAIRPSHKSNERR